MEDRPTLTPPATDEYATVPSPRPKRTDPSLAEDETPPTVSPTDGDSLPASLPPGPPPAEGVRGYEILGELGRGGMGVVYKARQVRLNRVVALKMILAGGHAAPEERLRFLAEAEAIAAVKHPGVIQVFDFGTHDGMPFFSMELCPGGSLADKLAGTPLAAREAARLVEQVTRAVQAAHEKGIVHRDLKAANVLITEDDKPKVTDFGLAKRVEAGAGLTQTGSVLGTPSYMAPEQAAGRLREIGPATDVYALGAILYECLTGRPPFRAPTVMETLGQVIGDEPASVRSLQPATPQDLETICLKCLQKETSRRYASARELADDLERFLRHEPVRARPVGPLERGWRWCRRNPTAALSAAVVAMSLLGATGVSALFGIRAEQARLSEANRAHSEANAKQEAEQARRAAQRQLVELSGASGLAAAREGDHSLTLLWFARAVQLARDEPDQEEVNRIRFANWRTHIPMPEGTFTVEGFRHAQERIRTFQFSPDGNYLLVIASTGGCRVWDRLKSELVALPPQVAEGLAAAWEPKSGLLAVAGKEGRIRFLAPPAFQPTAEEVPAGEAVALAFSRDGRRVAWGGTEGARVWDREKKEHATPLLRHAGRVTTLSFSATGDLLATSARDLKARVFRSCSEDGEPLFPPVAHTLGEYHAGNNINGGPDLVAPRFAADDRVLFTVERTPQAAYSLIWRSATTGKLIGSYLAPPGHDYVTTFAVSPDATRVATAVWEGDGLLWDAQVPRALAYIPASRWQWFNDVTFAANNKTLVTCGIDGIARFWSVEDRLRGSLTTSSPSLQHPQPAVRASLSSDGRHLAIALWDGTVCLWCLPEGAPVAYSTTAGGGTLPRLSPDGQFVLPRGISHRSGTQRDTRVYRADSGKAAGPRLDSGGILVDAAFSPDGTRLATANLTAQTPAERNQRVFEREGKAGNVQLWDWKSGKRLAGPIAMPGEPRGLAFRPDGRTLAVVCADYRVVLVDARRGTITHNLDSGIRTRALHRNANLWWSNGEARFSPDGRFLVTWEQSPLVHVWDPDRGQLLATLPHDDRVQHVSFSPVAPALLATACSDARVRVWDLAAGKMLARLPHPGSVARARFTPDGIELLSACSDGMLRLWDWQAGKLKEGLSLHSPPARWILASRRIAAGWSPSARPTCTSPTGEQRRRSARCGNAR
jgi:serine/threonine protein kinase/WD40 repeat protein